MERLHISLLFCADGPYFQHLGATIASILKANPDHEFEVFVCSEVREPRGEKKLTAMASGFGNATITFLEFSLAQVQSQLRVDGYISIASYLRLFLTEFLDPRVTKVLYLDCDVIVSSDLRELWQNDLGGAFAAAVPDPDIYGEFGFERWAYFNAGVLLIDVARWREAEVLPKFLEFAVSNAAALKHHDQDVVNCVLRGKIKALDYRWNFHSFFPDVPPENLNISADSFNEIRRLPAIVHSTTEYKPWVYLYEPHYKKLYYQARALTPWKNCQPPDRTARSVVLRLVKMKYLKERMRWYAPRLARFLNELPKGNFRRSPAEKRD